MPKAQTATKPKPAAARAGARPSTSRAAPKVAPKAAARETGRAEAGCQGSRPQGAGRS